MNPIPIPDLLDKAAGVIEVRGWHQGGYMPDLVADRDTNPVCVLAAINVACGQDPVTDLYGASVDDAAIRAAAAFADHLGLGLLYSPIDVVDQVGETWNDEDGRTAEQVTTALRECAAGLRAGA